MRGTPDIDRSVQMNLTPLIDVGFLLLLFFLVCTRFTTLENKVAALLPRYGYT